MATSSILTGEFCIQLRSKRLFSVVVDRYGIQFAPAVKCSDSGDLSSLNKTKRSVSITDVDNYISLDDIVGCDCQKGPSVEDTAAYLAIYAYSVDYNDDASLNCRKRRTQLIKFENQPSFELNFADATRWKNVLTCLLKKIPVDSERGIMADLQLPVSKKLLVLVNPFSGQGQALQLFQRKVVPVFAEACLQYSLITTDYAGHAKELMQTINLDDWSGIVIVSGDGLVYEVVNGLMARSDWCSAIKMPIGVVPGGSGNALSCAICHSSGESYLKNHLMHASYIIAKHDVVPMDLVAVDTASGKRLYSFLSVGWGMMADVDIESEKYRQYIGGARFMLMAVFKIAAMQSYRGKLSYLPIENDETNPSKSSESDPADRSSREVRTPLLVPLDRPVPDNWVTIEGEFILAGAVYQSHLAKDNRMAVESTLDDGIIYLAWVKAGISRLAMIQMLASLENGLHISDSTHAAIVKTRAFRLEPAVVSPPGIMTVDGESIDYGALQGQILPSMARVMSKKRK